MECLFLRTQCAKRKRIYYSAAYFRSHSSNSGFFTSFWRPAKLAIFPLFFLVQQSSTSFRVPPAFRQFAPCKAALAYQHHRKTHGGGLPRTSTTGVSLPAPY